MEVAVPVTVGDGNDEEVLMSAALRGGQPLQGPVQLALAGTLGLGTEEQKSSADEKGGKIELGL